MVTKAFLSYLHLFSQMNKILIFFLREKQNKGGLGRIVNQSCGISYKCIAYSDTSCNYTGAVFLSLNDKSNIFKHTTKIYFF